jgi:hypothetical protein
MRCANVKRKTEFFVFMMADRKISPMVVEIIFLAGS